ncbi:MAG: class GN sortase [Acidiferrobacterales bacterium]|nr:class GN sortase [Acidiferrobacterales bacterium]
MSRMLIAIGLTIGAGLVFEGSYIKTKAVMAQILISTSWAQRSATSPPRVPWPWADTHAIAKLSFSKTADSQMVMKDASGESLAFGPGMVSTGQFGSAPIVIAGHRDTHFKNLQKIAIGDVIDLEHWHGKRQRFNVTSYRILDTNAESLTIPSDQSSLILITCWPFDALVPGGPERFIVIAETAI